MAHDQTPESAFTSDDIDLVSFLCAVNLRYTAVIPPQPGSYPARTAFAFARSPELENALEVWQSGRTTDLSPRRFAEEKLVIYHLARSLAGGAR